MRDEERHNSYRSPNIVGIIEQEVLGRTNRLLPLIRHGPHRTRRLQQCFFVAGGSLLNHYLAMIRGYTDGLTDNCVQ
jgi:hypothetical protein